MMDFIREPLVQFGALGLFTLTLLLFYIKEKAEVRRLNKLIYNIQEKHKSEIVSLTVKCKDTMKNVIDVLETILKGKR